MGQPPSMHMGITEVEWMQFRHSWLNLPPLRSDRRSVSSFVRLCDTQGSDPQRTERMGMNVHMRACFSGALGVRIETDLVSGRQ